MTHSDAGEAILRRLSTGEASSVLVADFQAMSMTPRLSEMLSECAHGQAVFQIDPVSVLSGSRLYASLAELAAGCADEFLRSGANHGRVFVVGHCSAAPLALHVADRLASARSVTTVLVNPSWPDDDHVTARFAEFLARFGSADRLCPDLDADPRLVVSEMERVFREEMTVLAAKRGLSGGAGAFSDLLMWYRAWLAFLLAGRNDRASEHAAGRAPVTVLSDRLPAVTVPGLSKDAYRVQALPPLPEGTVTRELAEIVAAHLADQSTGLDSDARLTLEAFADTIVPGQTREPGDRAIAGAMAGPGAVAAGALELLADPATGLAEGLPGLASALDEHSRAHAGEHGVALDPSVPPFTALPFEHRTAIVRTLMAPGHPEKDFWVLLALFCFMAFDTGAHLHTTDAIAAGHPGLATMGFAQPDADGLWRFADFSYGRQLASPHPDTTPAGDPA